MCNECNDCLEPCVDPCQPCQEPVRVPLPLCYLIEPCNTGCVETFSTDCVILGESIGPLFKGETLTNGIRALVEGYAALARVYNLTNSPQIITYSFDTPDRTFNIVVRRNNIEVLNQSYSSLSTLLNDLQAIEPGWSNTGTIFYVGGTSTWQVTVV